MSISNAIKQLRKEKAITQEKLAELVGVSLMTIRRWEWGKTNPDSKSLNKLAAALGTTVESLLKEDTNEDTISEYTKEQVNNKQGMATMSLGNGRNLAVPATPEGYAFLERMFALAMRANGGQAHA